MKLAYVHRLSNGAFRGVITDDEQRDTVGASLSESEQEAERMGLLFAAAPDMAQALRDIIAALGHYRSWKDTMPEYLAGIGRAAIALAEGER